jgi:hypothetical protein
MIWPLASQGVLFTYKSGTRPWQRSSKPRDIRLTVHSASNNHNSLNMPFFSSGYRMEHAKFRKVIPKAFEDDKDDDIQSLLRDKDTWWFRLKRDIRAKTPLPGSSCSFAIFTIY